MTARTTMKNQRIICIGICKKEKERERDKVAEKKSKKRHKHISCLRRAKPSTETHRFISLFQVAVVADELFVQYVV